MESSRGGGGAAGPPPPTFGLGNLPDGSKGGAIFRLEIALIIISTFLMASRLYIRAFMIKALGLDDLLAMLAFVGLHLVSLIWLFSCFIPLFSFPFSRMVVELC